MVFTPVEEVQGSLVVPWEAVGKVARDFSKEERVGGPNLTISWVALEGVVVHTDKQEAPEEEEDIPGGAVEITTMIPVGVEEAPTMLEKISRVNAVITQMAMVGLSLLCCSKIRAVTISLI